MKAICVYSPSYFADHPIRVLGFLLLFISLQIAEGKSFYTGLSVTPRISGPAQPGSGTWHWWETSPAAHSSCGSPLGTWSLVWAPRPGVPCVSTPSQQPPLGTLLLTLSGDGFACVFYFSTEVFKFYTFSVVTVLLTRYLPAISNPVFVLFVPSICLKLQLSVQFSKLGLSWTWRICTVSGLRGAGSMKHVNFRDECMVAIGWVLFFLCVRAKSLQSCPTLCDPVDLD